MSNELEEKRIGECLARTAEHIECLRGDGYSEQNIAAGLAMCLQGLGITPEQYAASFDAGRAIYNDYQNYHTDDDGRALPPPGTTP